MTNSKPPTSTQSDKELEQILDTIKAGGEDWLYDEKNYEQTLTKLTHLIAEETNTARIDEIEQAKNAWAENRFSVYREERLATLKANKGKS